MNKKSWKKPTMCQVAAGFEISRYLPAETPPRKQAAELRVPGCGGMHPLAA
ncbi:MULTISPECIES: hypothetical protein [unclassified Mesorhizobium]|uniref:hypothetical protein n=1 Tax=unclassified Mesorhizobium TaxID=325217 RepID=UPI002415A67D|nr:MULTISPECIES: hypothetical protein [unclassified Mesorhizobium]MDG4899987.1 hypothetical protein [Mesorhizobium sp. WSM4962]MDG4917778.1 hypothetical protein [Mesorhizobium sp. WSM4989]